MLIVKVSTPWSHIDFNNRVSQDLNNQQFVFDFSDDLKECDYWIIWGGTKFLQQKVYCPPENVIYLTDEAHDERFFNRNFLQQFAAIITCRTDLEHKRIIASHELNTWMIDRTLDYFLAKPEVPKSKILSVVCSDQTWLPGHKLRYAFVNKLIGHFKDKLDVFGRGFNPVRDKYDALAPYKYSIAIENSSIPGYFTEKITDCFLTNTLPLYYGCPDIEKYYPASSFVKLDLGAFNGCVATIESILSTDPYDSLLPSIQKASNLYLSDYHIFSRLPKLLESHFTGTQAKKHVTIQSEIVFQRGYRFNAFFRRVSARLPMLHNALEVRFRQDDLYANLKKSDKRNR